MILICFCIVELVYLRAFHTLLHKSDLGGGVRLGSALNNAAAASYGLHLFSNRVQHNVSN